MHERFAASFLAIIGLAVGLLWLVACGVTYEGAHALSPAPSQTIPAEGAGGPSPEATPSVEGAGATPTPGGIWIEVAAGAAEKAYLAPGETAAVPYHCNLAVMVHYPEPLGSTDNGSFQPYPITVTVEPPTWQVEMGDFPTSDTLSFRLRDGSPGRFDVAIDVDEQGQPVTFTLEVLSPPAATPTSARTVTLADDGQTIELQLGERFLLDLGSDFDWTVSVADQDIVSRVIGILVIRGAQGLYQARQPGHTTLTAIGDPPCRKAQPACGMPSRLFQIDIVVR